MIIGHRDINYAKKKYVQCVEVRILVESEIYMKHTFSGSY